LSHALGKLPFLIPHERALAGEQEVDLLERATGSLGEETVYDGDVGEHGGTEDVEGLRKRSQKWKYGKRKIELTFSWIPANMTGTSIDPAP
jgi:hypothetical protein